MVDLSSQPDREAMWYMEVAEAYNLLPPSQIVSHSKNLGESNFFKFD